MTKRYRIFFSHGREDTYMANLLKEKIEGSGASVFLDAGEIQYGIDFRKKLVGELRKFEEFLVLLTPSSIHRTWVHAEIGAAMAREKTIIPVSYGIDSTKLEEVGLLSLLGNTPLLSLNDFDAYIGQLANRVQGQPR